MDENSKYRKFINTKSTDLSNMFPLHTTRTVPNSTLTIHGPKPNQIHNYIHNKKIKENGGNEVEEDGAGEIFGEILKRARSVSRSSSGISHSERIETKQSSLVNLKAFSMSSTRRSTSMSQGRYCKIYDQSEENTAEDNNEKLGRSAAFVRPTKKKGGKFFRSWYRLFGI